MVGVHGDADGDGDTDGHGCPAVPVGGDRGVPDRRAEPLRDDRRAPGVGLRQQQHELLAALPEGEVDLADLAAHPAGELGQHGVPRRVAVRVVDGLEPVQVEGEDAEHPAEPARPLDLPADRLLQVAVVPQPGERVGQREPLRLLVHPDVVHRHRGVAGEGAQGDEVVVVELVRAEPVVEGQHTERPGGGGRLRPGARGGPVAGGAVGRARRAGGRERHRDVRPAVRLPRRRDGGLHPPPARLPGRRDGAHHTAAQRHPQRPRGFVRRVGLVQPLGALRDEHPAVVDEQHRPGPGAGRRDRAVQDHPQDALQVVGAGQGVPQHREVPAQLVAAAGQRRHVGARLAGHPVERAGQPADLVPAAHRHPGGQVAARHPVHRARQLDQRAGRDPGQPPGGHHGQQGRHQHRRAQCDVQAAWSFAGDREHQRQGLPGGRADQADVPAVGGLGDALAVQRVGGGEHGVAYAGRLGAVGEPDGRRGVVDQGDRHPRHGREARHEGRVDRLRGGDRAERPTGPVAQVGAGRERPHRPGCRRVGAVPPGPAGPPGLA